jgi:hypothetical protein
MFRQLQEYTAEHRYLLAAAAKEAGFTDPLVVHLADFYAPLLRRARRGALLPIDGVLVRDWDPDNRALHPGCQLGLRVYHLDGLRFVRVRFAYHERQHWGGLDFIACDRKDYTRLYRIAWRCRQGSEPPAPVPVLTAEQADVLWKNTIGYLEPENLRRVREYGGRAKRGLLLMGPPGNGKTMACRWIWEECRRRRWDWRLVTPDLYRQARGTDSVMQLFSVPRRGIIFFDDMDLALRDRETVRETDDQAVFLSAVDGMPVNEGVVFVFTSNCAPELIDRAFKRPGRLDVVLHFQAPDAALRRQLIGRWHADILRHIPLETAVGSTAGYSFAEIEELKNLLIMRFMEAESWDWGWALEQFDINRQELCVRPRRQVGFGQGAAVLSSAELDGEEIPY